MKRLILMFAAAASVATALPLGELAYAQGRGRDRGSEQHGNRGGDRGGGERGGDRAGSDRGGGRRDDGRRDQGQRYEAPRGDYRRVDEGRRGPPQAPPGRARPREDDRRNEERPRRYEDAPRRYEEGPPPQSRAFAPPRRGGYLQEVPRGGPVSDYQRHRLRPPPRGYSWYRVPSGYALVSEADGRVFDVIPD